ncbi:hypothetical protein GPECTOR_7g935 [Gonium pectorale]|uniref:Phosphatidylserine decarboxylase n=1 Tax=Gonium pectorale TaxID=33097 RepID=A0A150GUE6_GONPE|nr:hypothetical protein GPECTOR_7g935 [Gonium pectorale]|eukprot:KXZ53485.1 hypothetical protein GPECTOR_7g935 [Gonium pectorale]
MGGLISKFDYWETSHCLVDRETGQRINEPLPFPQAFRRAFLYSTPLGHMVLSFPPSWWIIGWQHKRLATYANSPRSKKDIQQLIKDYNIDTSSSEKPVEEFATLQEFFARKLKPELRPISQPDDPRLAVMPADSRCVVYDSVDSAHRFWIKGRHFSVPALLGLPAGAHTPWDDCNIAINRQACKAYKGSCFFYVRFARDAGLAPMDCHRLHACTPGRVARISMHGRRFMGSEWAATHSSMNVMAENERMVMEIDSPEFGPVVQVMIGASDVGSIVSLVKEGQTVRKADEVAYFGFGGSMMATLFVSGSIEFEPDLRKHTAASCETRVNYGSPLGRATGHGRQAPAEPGQQQQQQPQPRE